MAKLEIKGVSTVMKALQKIEDQVNKETGRGLYTEANFIMTKSKILTPVDTGNLRATGHVEQPKFKKNKTVIEVDMGYGGPAAGYAVYVHEDLNAFHAPPTMAKFLEFPFLQAASGMKERLSAHIKKAL
jgi:hypothetical protein